MSPIIGSTGGLSARGYGLFGGAKPLPIPPVAGVALWYDSSDSSSITISSGTSISKINDLSGNNRHATQSTSAQQPTLVSNVFGTLPAMLFDNVNDNLAFSLTTGPASTTFVVVKFATDRTTTSDSQVIGSTSNYLYFGNLTGGISGEVMSWISNTAGNIGGYYSTTTIAAGNYQFTLQASTYAGTIRKNKVAVSTTEYSSGFEASNYPANWTSLGGDGVNIGPANAYIAEVLIYNSSLSTTDRNTVENYLSTKWGL